MDKIENPTRLYKHDKIISFFLVEKINNPRIAQGQT